MRYMNRGFTSRQNATSVRPWMDSERRRYSVRDSAEQKPEIENGVGVSCDVVRGPRTQSFTLLEILITLIILTVGVIAITRAFNAGLLASTDIENVDLALNIAQAKTEEIKNTPFADLADSGPVPADSDPASSLARFNVTVDVAEGQNPMQVDVTVAWDVKGGQTDITLTTLIADY